MIYVGFQGIGKSTLCKQIDDCLDLESSHFILHGKRSDDWYKIYAALANCLSKQGKTVFISSHKELRKYMNEKRIPFTVVYPDIKLHKQWLQKLKDRYIQTLTEKNFRAWISAKKNYKEAITDLSHERRKLVITDMGYSLKDMILSERCKIK